MVVWPAAVLRLPPNVVRLPLQQSAIGVVIPGGTSAAAAAAIVVAAAAAPVGAEGLIVRLVHADLVGLIVVPLLDLEVNELLWTLQTYMEIIGLFVSGTVYTDVI